MNLNRDLQISIDSPISIREKVYNKIRSMILDGEITGGTRIYETRLAKQINTSRTPVREALHALEREGLLEAIPRVGYQVKKIKLQELAEICEIRISLEVLAAQWAINRISQDEIRALQQNIEQSLKEIKQGSAKSFLEKDSEFHEIIAKASQSERLMELCQLMRRHMLFYRIKGLHLKSSVRRAIDEHQQIVKYIIDGNELATSTAIRNHLQNVKESLHVQIHDFESG